MLSLPVVISVIIIACVVVAGLAVQLIKSNYDEEICQAQKWGTIQGRDGKIMKLG